MGRILNKLIETERLNNFKLNIRLLLNSKYKKSFCKVKRQFREINDTQKNELYAYLSDFYFSTYDCDCYSYLNTEIGKKDMNDHMFDRLIDFRRFVIPWLNSIVSLPQCKILEIGCGTGCTTVALAEQDCELSSIDVDSTHIKVAQKRCEIYDLSVNIHAINATCINEINEKFDMIIFSASLEHMTYEERLTSIKLAWNMIKKNGFLVVIETPNRLHYFDGHSSILPFYHWLPDEIAIQYSKFSPREACKNSSSDEMAFIRFGRGASFHEFELALGKKCADMTIYDMQSFLDIFISKVIHRNKREYSKLLKKIGPAGVPDGFYHSDLYIAIEKS